MDSNITIDEEMGTVEFDVNDIKNGDVTMKTFKFFNVRNFYYAGFLIELELFTSSVIF